MTKLGEIADRFKRLFSLRGGTDVAGTIRDISSGVRIRGVTALLLVCSAILASVGLDINSSSVIIGAMLISPLMSPILGVGLGIAIENRKLVGASFQNLGLAILISLGTSFVYFLITPLAEVTPEITARTTPTILDVGVAFFGGIAGIAAGSRAKKTNAIPGVAIATALMPPLCVAGFGLASGKPVIFFGAFYLFFINAVFISVATFLMAKWLHFPRKRHSDKRQAIRSHRLMIALAILVMIPSALIFSGVIKKLRYDNGIRRFVNTRVRDSERQPIQWELDDKVSPPVLTVYTVGRSTADAELTYLKHEMRAFGVEGTELKILAMNITPGEFQKLSETVQNNFADRVKLIQGIEDSRKNDLAALRDEIADLRSLLGPETLFPGDVLAAVPELAGAVWETERRINGSRRLRIKYRESLDDEQKTAIRAKIVDLAAEKLTGVRIEVADE